MCSNLLSSLEDLLPRLNISYSKISTAMLYALLENISTRPKKEDPASHLQHQVLYLRGRKSCRIPSSKRDFSLLFPPPLAGYLLLIRDYSLITKKVPVSSPSPSPYWPISSALHHSKYIMFLGCAPTEGEKYQRSEPQKGAQLTEEIYGKLHVMMMIECTEVAPVLIALMRSVSTAVANSETVSSLEVPKPNLLSTVPENSQLQGADDAKGQFFRPTLKRRHFIADNSLDFPVWRANSDGSVPCPPKARGGCGIGMLELRRIFEANWVEELVEKARS
ncbi:LOW QUALITY PROTEIN: hypothetical protein OSB04_017189 [Centaurea solstitialis]|uniref:Uncharacterized protein n=1 Tax=Centaurea solstitialis TaxID=347529 RepID=A0AA38WKH4_9ASTR|nr:LOW QUALITY PROTEIN: hypothetical protein OSB04_017189 [Centaurea solstitialis]